MFGFLLRLFMVLLLMVLVTLGAVLFLALEKQPSVSDAVVLDNQQAARAERLVKTAKTLIQNPYQTSLSTSQQDLNGALVLLTRAHPWIAGRINVSRWGVMSAFSLKLPANPVAGYLNLALQVNPSPDRLDIETLQLGRIDIPGNWVLLGLKLGLDLALGEGQGEFYTTVIRGIETNGEQVTFHLRTMREINGQLLLAGQRLEALRNSSAAFGQPKVMADYYQHLLLLAERATTRERGLLSYYLGPTWQLAAQRSAGGASAVEENRNAILALGLAFGGGGLEKLIGKKRLKGLIPERSGLSSVRVAGRGDLVQHYLVSAALKIVSDSGLSYAIGEYKELVDSNEGGSGFSFADLAADRSGVRLAELASADETSARRLQDAFKAGVSEFDFFPGINDLPEGLSDRRFKQEYGSIDSSRYRDMVEKIDRRIGLLPVYRSR